MAILCSATFAVYLRALYCDFLRYDDGLYVYANLEVLKGLTKSGVVYAFTTFETGSWQPIALLSHMLDMELFGTKAWGHHLTSVLLHVSNVCLIAITLKRLCGQFYPGFVVAAIFGLHPAHVESVAWISERKDVLSTIFFLLCLLNYERFVKQGGVVRYIILSSMFLLGLMAKPMLVSLPLILILLDYWPLKRFGELGCRKIVIEKTPLIALSVIICIVTVIAQEHTQSIVSLENLSLTSRAANVVISYMRYVYLLFVPAGLAIDYPYREVPVLSIEAILSGIAFLMISAAAIGLRARAPYFLMGWAWYVVSFFPVIGIVQVGVQSMADRYTYIPSIGLSIALVWCVWDLTRSHKKHFRLMAVSVGSLLLIYSALTWRQIGFWKDTESLWKRAIAVNAQNDRALRNLSGTYIDLGRYREAIIYLEKALSVAPPDSVTYCSLAFAKQELGMTVEALRLYRQALALDAKNPECYLGVGYCLLRLGRVEESVAFSREALRMQPYNPDAASNLGVALCILGQLDEAIAVLTKAIVINGNNPKLHNNLGVALFQSGKLERSIEHFYEALRLDPSNQEAKDNLELLQR